MHPESQAVENTHFVVIEPADVFTIGMSHSGQDVLKLLSGPPLTNKASCFHIDCSVNRRRSDTLQNSPELAEGL